MTEPFGSPPFEAIGSPPTEAIGSPPTEPPAAPAPPPSAHGPVAGVFEFENNDKSDQFNLKPLASRPDGIPEDQRNISGEAYEARNVLKLLQEQGAFKKAEGEIYNEFIKRVVQAAEAGCVGPNVDTGLAANAFKQIRADIVRRKGRFIVYRYLSLLALWALGGAAIGGVLNLATKCVLFSGLTGYGWVIIGSMIGAWISVASGRREVSFDAIPDFLNYGSEPFRSEPFIRMLFVALVALVFALFLQLKIISVTIASFDLSKFSENMGWALAIGVIAGIAERSLSVQLIERAQNALAPATR